MTTRFHDTAPVDHYDLHRAVTGCDKAWLWRLGQADPVNTLAFLDVTMRGLTSGYDPSSLEALLADDDVAREHVDWIMDMDARLRLDLRGRQRDADVEIVRAPYMAGDLMLVVGAGVSMAAGLPGWRDLVLRLLRRALWYGSSEHREELRRAARGGGVINIAGSSYVVDPSEDADARAAWADRTPLPVLTDEQRELATATVDALASHDGYTSESLLDATRVALDFWGSAFNKELSGLLSSYTVYRTRLHPAIARMVRPREPEGLTPRVWAIVTYNFDTLIESAVFEAGQGFTVRWSEDGEPRATRGVGLDHLPNAVEIHHAHGFIPSFPFPRDPAEVDLVLSAEHYERHYGSENAWTRKLQAGFLGHAPALIIGSSLQDAYTVDQLVGVRERRPWWHHYAAMLLPPEHVGDLNSLDEDAWRRLTVPFDRMGLRVLWLSSHDELPDLLDEIRTEPPERAARRAAEAAMRRAQEAHEAGDVRGEAAGLEEAMAPGGTLGSRAAFYLGLLCYEHGSAETGEQLFLRTIASSDREWSGLSGSRLGYFLAEQGRLDEARDCYQHALASDHPAAESEARAGLANLADRA